MEPVKAHEYGSATRLGPRLRPDPSRVVSKLLIPGEESPAHPSRVEGVLKRLLALDEKDVEVMFEQASARFAPRHRDLEAVFLDHFEVMAHRLHPELKISSARMSLIGAFFTNEFSVEGAALTNPSIVPAPDQSGLNPGELRFVMSARCVGEGHISSIGFRTGVVGPGAQIRVDEVSRFVTGSRPHRTTFPREVLGRVAETDEDAEVFAYFMNSLPEQVSDEDISRIEAELPGRLRMRPDAYMTIARIRLIAASCYETHFPDGWELFERILWPASPAESHGMEDARFVRFTHDDGTQEYQATYTAFDGAKSASALLRTPDFVNFQVFPMRGHAAHSKGLALFPRAIGGTRYAICRPDLESLSLTASDDGIHWHEPELIRRPHLGWELLQSGNCGSPIELPEGWLVVTHGVGPVREYRLGAILLDLDDPKRVIAELAAPLLIGEPEERDGYVPNAVYSCGTLVNDGHLMIPYGFADNGIGFASVPVAELLEHMSPLP